jgi:hypothetical protein
MAEAIHNSGVRGNAMSYWERLKASTRHLKGMRYFDTVKVEVWYDCTKDPGGYLPIEGREQVREFLVSYASFAEVSKAYGLPETIDHINCVNDQGLTIEEFYANRPSLNEREIEHRSRGFITLACVILISFLGSCAPTIGIPPTTTESRFASTPPEARPVLVDDEFAREMKTLTADIRQQIQAYHQIGEDFEALWSRLSDLARHAQFKSVTARVNSAFRANSHAERIENLQKISAQMSPDEKLITHGYLKWFLEVRAIDKRFAALDGHWFRFV